MEIKIIGWIEGRGGCFGDETITSVYRIDPTQPKVIERFVRAFIAKYEEQFVRFGRIIVTRA